MANIVITQVTMNPNPVKTSNSFKIAVCVLPKTDEPTSHRLAYRLGTKKGGRP